MKKINFSIPVKDRIAYEKDTIPRFIHLEFDSKKKEEIKQEIVLPNLISESRLNGFTDVYNDYIKKKYFILEEDEFPLLWILYRFGERRPKKNDKDTFNEPVLDDKEVNNTYLLFTKFLNNFTLKDGENLTIEELYKKLPKYKKKLEDTINSHKKKIEDEIDKIEPVNSTDIEVTRTSLKIQFEVNFNIMEIFNSVVL